MRLDVLDHGHRRRARLFLATVRRMSGVDMPDVVTMLLYRPDFFGRPMLALTVSAMRGRSYWTAGEREFLAMSTARLFECPFCIDAHTELTRLASRGSLDPDDPGTARPELVAVRDFLATVTRTPDRVEAGGIAGLPERAVADALHVNLVWNTINRLAHAFGFRLREGQLHAGTRALHRFGYRLPGFLLSGGTRGDRSAGLVENLRRTVLESPGRTDRSIRAAAAAGTPLDEPWQTYTSTVRDAPHRVTDADLARLTAAGHSQDEIFELTVATAVGAALRSFEAGRRAVRAEA